MKLLIVAGGPPTTDPAGANGSTMITAALVPHAAVGRAAVVGLVRAGGPASRRRGARPGRRGRRAARAVGQGGVPGPAGDQAAAGDLAASGRPRAGAWTAPDRDVTYLHGLHTFAALPDLTGPVVAHEVDPWSDYWTERAEGRRGPGASVARLQAARARRLEALAAQRADSLVVVNQADADRLRARTGGNVVAVPNGTARPTSATDEAPEPDTIAFVGTLDYPPNVEAMTRLVRDVLPLVRRRVPGVRLLVAGRRATPEVQALAGPGVELLGEVDDVSAVFRRAQLAVYPGRTGRGTKNTVAEAVGAGCPVVASVESARGHAPGAHLRTGETDQEIAEAITGLLTDPAEARAARVACGSAALALADWDDAAARYVELFRRAAGAVR